MSETVQRDGQTRPIAIRGWVIFYASSIHMTWAIALSMSPEALNVAPINKMADWLSFNHYAAAAAYLLAGFCAWWGGTGHKYDIFGLVLGIPQLLLLFMSTEACIEVVISGVHPDGTMESAWFFMAQLAGSLWLGPVYMVAVYWPYWKALSHRNKGPWIRF